MLKYKKGDVVITRSDITEENTGIAYARLDDVLNKRFTIIHAGTDWYNFEETIWSLNDEHIVGLANPGKRKRYK